MTLPHRRASTTSTSSAPQGSWERAARQLTVQLRQARNAASERERRHKREMDELATRQAQVNRDLVATNAQLTAEINKLKLEMRVIKHGYACLELSVSKVVPVLHAELEAEKASARRSTRNDSGAAHEAPASAEAIDAKGSPTTSSPPLPSPSPPSLQTPAPSPPSPPPPPPPPPHVDEGIPELPPTPPDYDSYPDACTAETPLLASPIRSNSPSPTKCRKSTRTRRRSLVTSDWESGDGYREPSLRSKLRQGMSHTFGHE